LEDEKGVVRKKKTLYMYYSESAEVPCYSITYSPKPGYDHEWKYARSMDGAVKHKAQI
jgi:hypothetical protein